MTIFYPGTTEPEYSPHAFGRGMDGVFAFLELYNVSHVVTYHERWVQRFRGDPGRYEEVFFQEGGHPKYIFRVKRPVSFALWLHAIGAGTGSRRVAGVQRHGTGGRLHAECRLDGRPARFLRFAGTSADGGGGTWQAAELFVFRRTGEGVALDEREARDVAAVILREGIEFTACDRWLSAELLRALPERRGRPPAYPRFNPKHKATQLSREVRPVRGMAVAVARELEAECAAVLATCAGAAAGWETIRFPHYVLFVSTDSGVGAGGGRMVWNGQTLLAYGGLCGWRQLNRRRSERSASRDLWAFLRAGCGQKTKFYQKPVDTRSGHL